MRRLVILALLLLPVLPAFAEEESGTTCDLQALVDPDDAGLLVAYDGLRKGLEIARLPRVCRHDPAPETDGIVGFLERRAMAVAPLRENGQRIDPFFVFGDESCAAVQKAGTNLPCVMAVTRYTAKRKPLVPLPRSTNGTLVYADLPVERIRALVRGMYVSGPAPDKEASDVTEDVFADDMASPLVELAGENLAPGVRAGFERAYGNSLMPKRDSSPKAPFSKMKLPPADRPPMFRPAILLLRVDPNQPGVPLERLLKASRDQQRPIISDNRAHFGLGAVVVIVPRHDLLGKAAADEGRKLRAGMKPRTTPRVIPGFEIWVDLAAADAIGLELPLSFLARADKLRRPRRAPAGAAR